MLELVVLSVLILGAMTATEATNCSVACLLDPDNSTEACNSTSHECLFGCVQGFVGSSCSRECSSNCKLPSANDTSANDTSANETDLCDFDSGACSFGCNAGFSSLTCSCSEHCVTIENGTDATCDEATGACSLGCKQGFAGSDCLFECPENCGLIPGPGNDTCDVSSGGCFYGCLPGYTGTNCSMACPVNCAVPQGDDLETCDNTSMECLHGCTPGFAGPDCSYNCSDYCRISVDTESETCDVSSDECLLGCLQGYAGTNCTIECPDNCGISDALYTQTCNETSGKCLFGCIQGYGGENCFFICPENCMLPKANDTRTCDETNATCLLGCKPGYAGPNCSFECPANCSHSQKNNTDICDYITGQCMHGCKPGLGGSDCSFVCPSTCMLPSENGSKTCNATTEQCLHGCQVGYAGADCSVECPQKCFVQNSSGVEICNATSEECLFGCDQGYAGANCSVKCPENCAALDANGTEVCNATSEDCLFGCKEGFYGELCENKCSDNITNCKRCSSSESVVCDECSFNFYRSNGECLQCNYYCKINSNKQATCREEDGYCNFGCLKGRYYGFRCGNRCPTTCKDECHRDTGVCLTGCKFPNYCGKTCELPCKDGCISATCNQTCTCTQGCISNKWGEQCDTICSSNCNEPPTPTNNICERSTGTCSYGCVNGTHWGNQCGHICSSNCFGGECEQENGNCTGGCINKKVYGVGCDKPCSENCVNGTCERDDGACDSGCHTGFFGDQCNTKCNVNCRKRACGRDDGYCKLGCIGAFYGGDCDTPCGFNVDNCLNRTCDRQFGNCTCKSDYEGSECETNTGENQESGPTDTNFIYVAIASGALVLLGVLVTIVLVTKKRRRVTKRRRADRLTKIPDEQFLEEAQMRHKRKGEGVGARVTQLFVENPLARFMKYRSHGGGLVTKIPLDELLQKVKKMDENDYLREFDEFSVGLTKSHEVSRKVDNLALNFFGGIYPYDENRIVLKHSLEDEEPKAKSKSGKRKTVHFTTFFTSRDTSDYDTLETVDGKGAPLSEKGEIIRSEKAASTSKGVGGKDNSNGYASVVFDIQNETDLPSQKADTGITDDYATVDIGGSKQAASNSEDSGDTSDYAKVDLGGSKQTASNSENSGETSDDTKVETGETSESNAGYEQGDIRSSSDYAVVHKDTDKRSSTDVTTDDIEYAHVNKAKNTDSDEQKLSNENANDEYAVIHKEKKPGKNDDVDSKNNAAAKIVIQKDYINASLIKGYNQTEKYIAAQAPSQLTKKDFWLMVWEQKTHFVIMLTVVPEDGYSRCEKYWPDEGDEETIGDIKVINDREEHFTNYIIRTFRLSVKNGLERDAIQMQFTAWPDEGCPVSAIEFIEFHQKFRAMTKKRKAGPSVIHCTAGIGRTGVFIALDILVEEGLDTLNVDVSKCVNTLREQRVDMVHSMDQYEFLYKCIAQTFALECQLYDKARFQEKVTDLKKFDHTSGKSKLEVLYDNMKASLGLDTAEIAAIDVVQERRGKDRPKSDVPDAVFRAGLPHNVYINAVIFQSLKKPEAMLATQMPTPDTLQDFCQLLIHHQCATVVMLNNFDPNDKSIGVYWPTGKTPVVAGKTIVSQLDVEKQSDYVIRQLRVHNPELSEDENSVHPITLIQYKGWKDAKKVPNAKVLLKLLQLCQRFTRDSPDKPLLVHCMNGAEQCGLFCALVNLLEVIDTSEEVSVTSVVRKILARRPNAIPTLEQFEMCFTATSEYIKRQENAANG